MVLWGCKVSPMKFTDPGCSASVVSTSTFLDRDSWFLAMVSVKSPDKTAFLVWVSAPFIVPVSVVLHLATPSP